MKIFLGIGMNKDASLASLKTVLVCVILSILTLNYSHASDSKSAEALSGYKDTYDAHSSKASSKKIGSIDELTSGLENRLKENPDDQAGWVLLSKSYYHLKQWDKYNYALEKAKNLGYTGDAKPIKNNSMSAHKTISKTMANDGVLSKALEAGMAQSKSVVSGTPKVSAPSKPTASGGLKLKITLDPSALAMTSQDSSVFIFARSADVKGPPLAVMRKQVSDFPLMVTLDDSMAMVPAFKISTSKNIIVGARISKSGSPMKGDGDIEQLSDVVPATHNELIELHIKK